MRTASWVVVDRATDKAILETFSPTMAAAINTNAYEVLPILDWLQRVNRNARQQGN